MGKLPNRLADGLLLTIAVWFFWGTLPKRAQTPREQTEEWMRTAFTGQRTDQEDWKRLFWHLGGPRALLALAYDQQAERAGVHLYRVKARKARRR